MKFALISLVAVFAFIAPALWASAAPPVDCSPLITATDLALLCHLSGEGKCAQCSGSETCSTTKEEAAAFLKAGGSHQAYRSVSDQTILQNLVAKYDVDKTSTGSCKLDEKKFFALMEQLIRQGADVNAIGQLGQTALHDAILSGLPEVAKFLLDHGADPKVKTTTGPFKGLDAEGYARALIKKRNSPKTEAILELLAAKKQK